MNKKGSKYLFIFTALVTFIGLLNSGCFPFDSWKSKSNSSRSISKGERMDMLEEKVATLSYSLGSLTTENYELKKNVSEQEAVKSQLTKEYTHIKNKQAALEKAQASDSLARNRLKGELAKTKATLEKIKQYLVDQSRKGLIKETQEKRKSSLVEKLLDDAIRLYREESFEGAIAKWEEVLVLDPGKLEAKFNIEIAQDRIKEKQIQKDLESTRIQKNR